MRRKAEETMGKVRRGTRAEMEEKGLRETVWSGGGEEGREGGRGGLARPLGGHGNYIFMRWFRQMALCRQKKKEEEEEGRGDENRKREGRD